MKTAETYAVSKADASLYVTDLCKAAGVSERTLEYAFKEVMGLTPVAYLVRLRLHRVRQPTTIRLQQSAVCPCGSRP